MATEKPIPWPDCLRHRRTMAEVFETNVMLRMQKAGILSYQQGGYKLQALLQRARENNPPEE